jgi:hypothetical protein
MPTLSINVPHSLGQPEAVTRLKSFLDRVKQRYQDKVSDLQETWQDNRLNYGFTTYGFNIKGDLTIEPSDVRVVGNLPFAAMMFKGQIEKTIRDELARVLT